MLEDFFEDFCMLDRVSVPDGFGSINYHYVEGAPFRAGITTDSTVEAQVAQQNGMKAIYTIVHPAVLTLKQDDHVKRMKDGRAYRVASNSADMTTPGVASVQYGQVKAEVVEA